MSLTYIIYFVTNVWWDEAYMHLNITFLHLLYIWHSLTLILKYWIMHQINEYKYICICFCPSCRMLGRGRPYELRIRMHGVKELLYCMQISTVLKCTVHQHILQTRQIQSTNITMLTILSFVRLNMDRRECNIGKNYQGNTNTNVLNN